MPFPGTRPGISSALCTPTFCCQRPNRSRSRSWMPCFPSQIASTPTTTGTRFVVKSICFPKRHGWLTDSLPPAFLHDSFLGTRPSLCGETHPSSSHFMSTKDCPRRRGGRRARLLPPQPVTRVADWLVSSYYSLLKAP